MAVLEMVSKHGQNVHQMPEFALWEPPLAQGQLQQPLHARTLRLCIGGRGTQAQAILQCAIGLYLHTRFWTANFLNKIAGFFTCQGIDKLLLQTLSVRKESAKSSN